MPNSSSSKQSRRSIQSATQMSHPPLPNKQKPCPRLPRASPLSDQAAKSETAPTCCKIRASHEHQWTKSDQFQSIRGPTPNSLSTLMLSLERIGHLPREDMVKWTWWHPQVAIGGPWLLKTEVHLEITEQGHKHQSQALTDATRRIFRPWITHISQPNQAPTTIRLPKETVK